MWSRSLVTTHRSSGRTLSSGRRNNIECADRFDTGLLELHGTGPEHEYTFDSRTLEELNRAHD